MNFYRMKVRAFSDIERCISDGMFLSEIIYTIQKKYGIGEATIRKIYANIQDMKVQRRKEEKDAKGK